MTDSMKRKNVLRLVLLCLMYMAGFMAGGVVRRISETAPAMEVSEYPDTLAEEKKQIAITFDDGPNPNYTKVLLKGLKKRGVKATFFLLGSEVDAYPEIVKRIQSDGHLIGVHSYEHVNFGQIGDEKALEQVEKTQEAIYRVTGEYPDFIRPPYGCWKKELDEEIPMIEVLWDVDPCDWATSNSGTVVKRILSQVKDGSIILLHDASKSSVQAAFTVIDVLGEEGYEFVTVEELMLGY